MTRAEVAQIFAVLVIAYPNAEMFKAPSQQALQEKLAPTISLWATCLRDVDFWTAQQATVRICQTCKFPPTIAEMREAADAVTQETEREIHQAFTAARTTYQLHGGDLAETYKHLPDRARKTIDAMGGMEAFAPPDRDCFDVAAFEGTYMKLLRKNPVGLPGGHGGQKAMNTRGPHKGGPQPLWGEEEQGSGATGGL